jgi:hypothetical protein
MHQIPQEHSRHDAILYRILDLEVDGFGGLGLFPEVVVPESKPTSAVVALLVVIAIIKGPFSWLSFLRVAWMVLRLR